MQVTGKDYGKGFLQKLFRPDGQLLAVFVPVMDAACYEYYSNHPCNRK